MPERVITEEEVSLNGNFFKLGRPVQTVLASIYPAKSLIGDITADSQQRTSVIRWSDARGGIGKKDHQGAVDVNRMWYSTSHLRVAGHRTLPDRVTTTRASGVPGVFRVSVIAEIADEIYTVFGEDVQKYDFNGDSWGSNLKTLPAAATDALTARLGGTVYMVFAHTGGATYTTDGSTFTDITDDMVYMTVWDDRIWGLDNTGQLRWAFDPTGTWTDDAQLPLPSGQAQDLFIERDAGGEQILYAATKVGLFAHDAANSRFLHTDMKLPLHDDAGKGSVSWRGSTYYPAGLAIYKYNPGPTAVISLVGPDRDQGLPSDRRGKIIRLENTHNDLIILIDDTSAAAEEFDLFVTSGMASHAAAQIDTDTGHSLILGYNELGHQVLFESGANEQAIDYSLVSSAYNGYRLWFAQNERIKFFALPIDVVNPAEITDREYANSSRDEFPWFDAGQAEVDKVALRLKVEVKGTSPTETVSPYYALDFDDAEAVWVALSAITSDGIHTYTFPNTTAGSTATPAVGTAFRAIRFRTDLANGSNKKLSPDVLSVTLEYRKKLPTRYGWSVELDLNRDYKGVTVKEQQGNLRTATASNTLVEWTFRNDDGDTRNYFVDITNVSGLEFTGHNEGGIVRLTLAQV